MKVNELKEGQVYLRDTRNGNIHPYENLLAQMSYIQKFIAGKKGDEIPEDLRPRPPMAHMTPLERAAEFDRLARMSNEEREAELAKQEMQNQAQVKADETPVPTNKKRYAMTAKAGKSTFKSFTDVGWTVDLLLKEGYLTEVLDPKEKADLEL